uniref:Non-structural protein NS1 n=1 Tax=Changuinola virus TaxID=40052 RepID=W5QLW3_9REOV|nr:NS1 [Changuinola virus]
MERFITRFGIIGDAAIAVKTFDLVSRGWTCSHVRRDCFYRGRCARQFFRECADACYYHNDLSDALQLVEIAVRALHDREKVWLNVFRHFQEEDEFVNETSFNRVMARAEELYQQSGMLDDVKQLRLVKNNDRVYLDDSQSFIHFTFIPIYGGHICKPLSTMRYGQIGIIFIDTTKIDSIMPHDSEGFLQEKMHIQNQVRRMLPVCPTTGAQSRIYNLAFAPIEMVDLMQDREFRLEVCRRLEMDFKYLHSLTTRSGPRMILQRTALESKGDDSGLHPYMVKVEREGIEDSLAKTCLKRVGNEKWQTWAFPELLCRMHNHKMIGCHLIVEYMQSGECCQICFLAERGLDHDIIAVDTRAAELTGVDPVRVVSNRAHADGSVKLAQQVLHGSQILTKLCDHWVVTNASSGMEAFVVTASCIHRHIRGKGLWIDQNWHDAMYQLGRLLLRFDYDQRGRTNLMRLFYFICFGYLPLDNGRVPVWKDLGEFLKIIMGGEINGMESDVETYMLMLDGVHSVIYLANQNDIVAVDAQDDPVDERLRGFGYEIEAHMHNQFVMRVQHRNYD